VFVVWAYTQATNEGAPDRQGGRKKGLGAAKSGVLLTPLTMDIGFFHNDLPPPTGPYVRFVARPLSDPLRVGDPP